MALTEITVSKRELLSILRLMLKGSAEDLSDAIRARSNGITALKVMACYLQLIERINKDICAIEQAWDASQSEAATLAYQQTLLKAASEVDRTIDNGTAPSKETAPLLGVPITVKANLNVKGLVASDGNADVKAVRAPAFSDAPSVAALRQSGALILGHTNIPYETTNLETESTSIGRTNNPYNLERTSGGSSGGEAAAIAAGISKAGLGNDGGGSIRVPALYCGIAGMRPSTTGEKKLVPNSGLAGGDIPLEANSDKWFVVGPMAQNVADLRTLLAVIAVEKLPEAKKIETLTVACYTSCGRGLVNPAIAKTVEDSAATLAKAGARVECVCPPGVATAWDDISSVLYRASHRSFTQSLDDKGIRTTLPLGTQSYLKSLEEPVSADEVQAAKVKWQVYREHMDKFMETHDIIINPGVPYTALAHGHYMTDEANQYALNNLACYSLLGYPAVTIRTGTAPDGMPMGIQIVAKTWDDLTALLVAEYIETNMKGAGYRPPLITQDAIASIWGKDILSSAELSDIGFT